MDFYLTQKLRKRFIKTEKVMGQSIEDAQLIEKTETKTDPFYHWHGTLSEIGHDELFIFTHNTTGMTLTFLNLVEDELIEFIDLFEEGLTQLLSRFGFPEHAINQYTQSIAGHRLTKATDMKKIGKKSIVHATLGRFTHLIDEHGLANIRELRRFVRTRGAEHNLPSMKIINSVLRSHTGLIRLYFDAVYQERKYGRGDFDKETGELK
ncbi:DUF6933 domain-containing protein [Alkalibacterium sp. MB6]|uniref:DUF6933 domain-containing protein n=1 Tax=Alkalibacterium sp. MB6 TaxID=2081965 RepID=UPI001F21E9D4|nr:hypothetical protein [Alkalibacterium sp. MB6]